MSLPSIRSMTQDEIEKALQAGGFEKYRGKQVFQWVQKGADQWSEMRNLPEKLWTHLEANFQLACGSIIETRKTENDDTRKYLIRMQDGQLIETVSMQYEHGHSVCVSTQAGCRMGCWFCASTVDGLARNLSAGEILTQIFCAARDRGKPVTHVVLMGSGEPLDNMEEVLRFLELAHDPQGLMISHRHITLSTCGLVPQIRELAKHKLQITLALSLHAPDDELRSRLIPVNRTYPIADVLRACSDYFNVTGRRITVEYALLKGINDSREHAEALAQLLMGTGFHINLIPANTIREKEFQPSKSEGVRQFASILKKRGLTVTVRREMGDTIDAACGQLRQKFMNP